MRSKTFFSDMIDEIDEAVEDIVEQIKGFELSKNSMGIVFADEEMDYPAFYEAFHKEFDFPLMGCTAMATLFGDIGYCDSGVSLMVLTADDCEFALEITDSLDKSNGDAEIAGAYERASSKLSEKEKLVISYGVVATNQNDVSGDGLIKRLDEVVQGVPIFGGLATEAFNYKESKVFCNDKAIDSGLVIALISGNINPKYVSVNSIENKSTFSFDITKSEGNIIYELNGKSLVKTLEDLDFIADKEDVIGDYLLSPFVVTMEQPSGDKVYAARNLSYLNLEEGSGTFLGFMPEGAGLSIGIINREDVQKSVQLAFSTMEEMIGGKSGYETLLCTTCCARFLALANDVKAEARVCQEQTPEGFSLFGMYSYGEFCPIKGEKTGKDYNMFHNFTFTILAI